MSLSGSTLFARIAMNPACELQAAMGLDRSATRRSSITRSSASRLPANTVNAIPPGAVAQSSSEISCSRPAMLDSCAKPSPLSWDRCAGSDAS